MVTYFLATVLGWYLVIMSFLLIFRRELVAPVIREVMAQPGLFLIMGLLTVIIGLLMVVSHNYWVMGWPVIVTLFAWIFLISGLFRVFFPDLVRKLWSKMSMKPETLSLMGTLLLIIGLFLLYKVYFV